MMTMMMMLMMMMMIMIMVIIIMFYMLNPVKPLRARGAVQYHRTVTERSNHSY